MGVSIARSSPVRQPPWLRPRVLREFYRPSPWVIRAFFQLIQGKFQVWVFNSPRDGGFVSLNSFLAIDVRASMGGLASYLLFAGACYVVFSRREESLYLITYWSFVCAATAYIAFARLKPASDLFSPC